MKIMNFKNLAGLTAKIMMLSVVFSYGCTKPLDPEDPDNTDNGTAEEIVLTDFQPQRGGTDNVITITGENFGTDKTNIRITFSDKAVDRIEELTDTKIVVKVPIVDVEKDTDIDLTITVGDGSKTFEKKFSYVYVKYAWMWITGSFNNWATDVAMEKDPVDPYTFHYTSDIISSVPDDNGERAFKFLTKTKGWVWGNTYNAVQEKAHITDTRAIFRENAGEDGVDWKWEFEEWQCGFAYEFTLSIKPGEEKMICKPVSGTPVPPEEPKEYTTVSTLNTTVPMADFRSMAYTPDGKILAVGSWEKIYSIDPKTGTTETLFDIAMGGPEELNGMAISKDGNTIYLACPHPGGKTTSRIFYLSKETDFLEAMPVASLENIYCSLIAVNPADGTVFFGGNDETGSKTGESVFRLDSVEEGTYTKMDILNPEGPNGASRLFFTHDGKKAYRLVYESKDSWWAGAIYVYDYDTETKTLKNGKILAGSENEGLVDGTGAEAQFNGATGGAIDKFGNLYIADRYNNCIRKVTPEGVVTTLAGVKAEAANVDGSLAEARFADPIGIVIADDGTLYVGQNGNGDAAPGGIRVIK